MAKLFRRWNAADNFAGPRRPPSSDLRVSVPRLRDGGIKPGVSAANSGVGFMRNKTPFSGVTEKRGALSMALRVPSPLSGAWRKNGMGYPEFCFASLRALFRRPSGPVAPNHRSLVTSAEAFAESADRPHSHFPLPTSHFPL